MAWFQNTLSSWAAIAVSIAAILAGTPAASADQAHIAVATNFQLAMDDLEDAFEAQSGHELIVSTGSSGLLYAQIRNGAPFSVFLSADQDRPARLVEAGYAVASSQFTYAVGKLVLWHTAQAAPGPDSLAGPDVRYVAVANPRLAPYGKAAIETLSALGLLGKVEPKLVRGENVGQAFAFVRTGNADLGFVALSMIGELPDTERGSFWEVPASYHAPIRQDAVLLERGAGNAAARAFIAFLSSPEARDIIAQHGYGVP